MRTDIRRGGIITRCRSLQVPKAAAVESAVDPADSDKSLGIEPRADAPNLSSAVISGVRGETMRFFAFIRLKNRDLEKSMRQPCPLILTLFGVSLRRFIVSSRGNSDCNAGDLRFVIANRRTFGSS